jgi:hypothetical protein
MAKLVKTLKQPSSAASSLTMGHLDASSSGSALSAVMGKITSCTGYPLSRSRCGRRLQQKVGGGGGLCRLDYGSFYYPREVFFV